MARGVKGSKNYEVEIAQIDEKIAKYKTDIASLEAKKEGCLTAKRESEMKEIYTFMRDNELTPEDVLKQLKSKTSE